MASRFIKKTVILGKLETVIGTDAVPTGADNAFKVFDVSITPVDMKEVKVEYITAWFGSSEALPGSICTKCSFSVSLSGSGTAADAPAWGAILLACGFSEITGLTVPDRVEYLPATDALKSMTFYWHDHGVLHKMLGAFGNVKLSAKSGEAPKLTFDFTGLEVDATATADATPVYTAWKPPVAIRKANVTDIKLGCTYAAGALAGGTAYNSTGLMLDAGNKVDFDDFLSTEEVGISDRDVTGSFSLKPSAAEEVALISLVKSRAPQGLGFVIGTVPGNKILIHGPAARLKSHKKAERNGKRMVDLDVELKPVNGNDELRIVSL